MDILNSFNIDIQNINIAHEFIINKDKKCEYLGGREHYGIVYCLDGEAEYVFSSKKHITISAGEVLLLKPDASYSISVNGNTEFNHNFQPFLSDQRRAPSYQTSMGSAFSSEVTL